MRPWTKARPPTLQLRYRASDVKKKSRTVWTSKTIRQIREMATGRISRRHLSRMTRAPTGGRQTRLIKRGESRNSRTSETQTVPRLASYLRSARDSSALLARGHQSDFALCLFRSRHHSCRGLDRARHRSARRPRWGRPGRTAQRHFRKCRGADHRRHRPFQRSDQRGESLHYGIDHR